MTAFTTTMSTVTTLNDSLVSLFSDLVYFGAINEEVVDQFAQEKPANGGVTVQFTKFTDLTVSTTALTEDEDATSLALSDDNATVTPLEQGAVVTRTAKASLQTGGKVDVAIPKAIGRVMGQTLDKLALAALYAGTPIATVYSGAANAASNLADPADKKFVNKCYNKLSRRNTPALSDGMYAMIAHGDVISDILEEGGSGSFVDVNKYKNPENILRNEVGRFGGFTWFRDANTTVTASQGSGSTSLYKCIGIGDDVLIKGVTLAPELRITGPFDKLGRFLNIGWYGLLAYGVLDGNNMVFGYTASTFQA